MYSSRVISGSSEKNNHLYAARYLHRKNLRVYGPPSRVARVRQPRCERRKGAWTNTSPSTVPIDGVLVNFFSLLCIIPPWRYVIFFVFVCSSRRTSFSWSFLTLQKYFRSRSGGRGGHSAIVYNVVLQPKRNSVATTCGPYLRSCCNVHAQPFHLNILFRGFRSRCDHS